MMNPEMLSRSIDPSTIYKYQTHKNIPWGIHEYRTPKQEVNISLEIQKRNWMTQKKGQKSNKYITRKGFYMDDLLKIKKTIPSTFEHGSQRDWSKQIAKTQSLKPKLDTSLKKNTYLDLIELNQSKRKVPGVSSYQLRKSLKQIEQQNEKQRQKKRSFGEKVYFHQNVENLSLSIPGAGNYCPHTIAKRVSPGRNDYKYWVDKHKKEHQRIKKVEAAKPSSSSYQTQLNTTIETFDNFKLKDFSKSKKKFFGGDSKFEYTRANKKTIIEKRPSPMQYKTIIDWKGKTDSPKKVIPNDLIWKGSSKSIYH